MIVEGQTEETFVRDVLAIHLGNYGVYASVRSVETGRKRLKIFRGGMTNYSKVKRDIERWMKQDGDAWFTTMFDLYALPFDFPGYSEMINSCDPFKRIQNIEKSMADDINDPRFIPYIQLHEFEALLFSDPLKFNIYFLDHQKAIYNLQELCAKFPSPEHINDGTDTAPSKRIGKEIPQYLDLKTTAGPIIAESIGLPTMRVKCNHFHEWLTRLEHLGAKSEGMSQRTVP
jgi:hypothetical protein